MSAAFRPAPGVSWAVDEERLYLVDGEGRRSRELRGLEAALWDLSSRGRSLERIGELLLALDPRLASSGRSPEEAARGAAASLLAESWLEEA
jgi:hypothetical protein